MKESDNNVIQVIAASTDLFHGDPDSDRVDCKNILGLKFVIAQSAGATGTAVITVYKHTADAAAGTAIPFLYRTISSAGVVGDWAEATTAGFTPAAGAEKTVEILVKLKELGDTYRYVYFTCTEAVDSPVSGMGLAILNKDSI